MSAAQTNSRLVESKTRFRQKGPRSNRSVMLHTHTEFASMITHRHTRAHHPRKFHFFFFENVLTLQKKS